MSGSNRYILQAYANKDHLEMIRSQTEYTVRISYERMGVKIGLAETNSLIEDAYCLNLSSAAYLAEGTTSKEAMIHHHKKGHSLRHLQFKLTASQQTIRIYLDELDETDYEACIKGFLHICQDLISNEAKLHGMGEDLQRHFFQDRIVELAPDRQFLLERIRKAFRSGQMTAGAHVLEKEALTRLGGDAALRPFLDWPRHHHIR